jgi:predicted ester cyclase
MGGEIVENGEQVVRRLVDESINTNQPHALSSYVDHDVIVHPGTPGAGPPTHGIEELQMAFGRFHQAFPDLHIAIEDAIASGDKVAVRWTATGTHHGGLAEIAATGRSVRWGGIDIYRLQQGKIVEWWRNDDFVGLLQQLGHDPLRP